MADWDKSVDLLVVGSGAGGMTAALAAKAEGADVLLIEKSAVYGGTTARSGGGVWVPNNPTLVRAGRSDPPEAVRTYLQAVVGDRVPGARLDAYVHAGPEAMGFLDQSPRMRFAYIDGYADYHPERPGGRPQGRTIEPLPINLKLLGEDAALLRDSGMGLPLGLFVTAVDARYLGQATRTLRGFMTGMKIVARLVVNGLLRRRIVALGQALVARFRLALKDADVPLWLGTPLQSLVSDEAGQVQGAVVLRDGKPYRIAARHGVILASGGFDHNLAMRKEHLPAGVGSWSAGSSDNHGDGIVAGQAVGGQLDLLDDAWWMPSVKLPNGTMWPLVSERCIPRSIIINGHGKRFANESAPYVNFVHALLRGDQSEGKHIPAYFVMDAVAQRRYQFAGNPPGVGFPKAWYRSGVVKKAQTLAQLAAAIDVPAPTLLATVERFNGHVARGTDADFGRGQSAYDRYYGDPTLPNPVIDRIDTGPFYAIEVLPGDLGTKGGLVCDEHARVLNAQGHPIAQLYATGNTTASVMGNDYAGAGATIGPAIVFGWVAARHALQRSGIGH